MKTRKQISVYIIISFVIITGYFITSSLYARTYTGILNSDMKNISKLTSMNIYSEITNQITKPIYVSLTMANDSFVKNWITKNSEKDVDLITTYLEQIRKKYSYDSVFLVSVRTNNYYRYDGIFKKVNENDDHDVWFYNFIRNDELYTLDVDTDQANQNQLTVFVNCKILGPDGDIYGVIGVGLKINKIQLLMKQYEKDYNLETMLIDDDGLIQVHTNLNKIEKINIFDDANYSKMKSSIQSKSDNLQGFDFVVNNTESYLISRYIKDLNWTLIIVNYTTDFKAAFMRLLAEQMIVIVVVLLLVLFIVISLIHRHQQQLRFLARHDSLTGLLNRRTFDQIVVDAIQEIKTDSKQDNKPETKRDASSDYKEDTNKLYEEPNKANEKQKNKNFTKSSFCRRNRRDETIFNNFKFILFDVDKFKKLNDTKGHLAGDDVLKEVARQTLSIVGDMGQVARWGGDEFAILFHGSNEQATATMILLQSNLMANPSLSQYEITISVGITSYINPEELRELAKRADLAMYQSKERGKNLITWL